MKIAIISDVHNNLANLDKVINYCNNSQINTIICCGDLASKETLDHLCDNFAGSLYYCWGNMEEGQLREMDGVLQYRNAVISRVFGEVDVGDKKIAFVHKPEPARQLCEKGIYDFVFYGHTHKPWQEKVDEALMINPGNVAGELFPPDFRNSGR